MADLFAGPWVGEFGWELFCWQGYLRKIAPQFDQVIVCGRSGHEVLYGDFCDQYVTYEVSEKADLAGPLCRDFEYNDVHLKYIKNYKAWQRAQHPEDTDIVDLLPADFGREAIWIPPQSFLVPYTTRMKLPGFEGQEFRLYGEAEKSLAYDIIIHARAVESENARKVERNWAHHKWRELLEKFSGLRVGSIGSVGGAWAFDKTEDLRGIPLAQLVNVLRSSKCIIGPSSGPMHLAALCDCPQVVWSTDQNIGRYTVDWNPFKTKNIMITEKGFDPDVQDVCMVLDSFLSKRDS